MRTVRFLLAVFLLIAGEALGGTYVVNTTADEGPGSLRQAILDANSGACPTPCQITFAFTSGVTTIEPLSPLPVITAQSAVIAPDPPFRAWTVEISGRKLASGDGFHIHGVGCSIRAMIINGFPGSGIVIEDSARVMISANVIGLDSTGTRAVPNQRDGVTVIRGHDIFTDSNTIGGNGGNGVYAVGVRQIGLGLDTIGKQYLPQGSGDRQLGNGATGVFFMDVVDAQFYGNVIVNNALGGVGVAGASSGVKLEDRGLPTLIYHNGGLAIDLGFDGLIDQNRPVLTVADMSNGFMRVRGEVKTSANADVDVNIFASDALNARGEADAMTAQYAAKIKSDANGFASFEFRFRPTADLVGQWISATATTAAGTTELSAPLQAIRNDQNYIVLNTEDSGAGSLRQAILDANSGICTADFPCRIEFRLPPPVPASGHSTIAPLTPLPPIKRSGIIVDGSNAPFPFFGLDPPSIEITGIRSTPGAGLTIAADAEPVVGVTIRRLAINGFRGDGIVIDGGGSSTAAIGSGSLYILNPVITNNFIGTDPSGKVAIPNIGAGIRVRGNVPFVHIGTYSSGNRIQRNLISGNQSQGVILESGFVEMEANLIGTDITKTLPIPNAGSGVYVTAAAGSHLEANTIAFNGKSGVSIASTAPTVFNGVIQNAIFSNAGKAIELRDDAVTTTANERQTPPEITSATYDPATNTATFTGSFKRTTAFPQWTPVIDFGMSTFPEAGGRGSVEQPLYAYADSVKDEGSGRFSFHATSRFVDLRGKRVSATATPFIYQGFKSPPQPTLFGQGFEYGTTSEMSKAIPVITVGCSADLPELVAPRADIATAAPVEFRWNAIAGASAYNVWLRDVPGMPRVVATTSGTTTTLPLQPGSYEWFVEALVDPCPSIKSDAASITLKRPRQRAVGR